MDFSTLYNGAQVANDTTPPAAVTASGSVNQTVNATGNVSVQGEPALWALALFGLAAILLFYTE